MSDATFLIVLLGAAFSFALRNGFHESADLMATIIAPHAVTPRRALLPAACGQFVGPPVLGVAAPHPLLVPVRSISMRCASFLAAAALLAVSCGGPDSSPADAGTLVARAADTMSTVATARFRMECSGAPMIVEGFEFQWAEGQFAAPSSSRSVLHMRAVGLAVELGAISIGDRTWLTNPLSGAWEELAPGVGFNPAVVFDPSQGWAPLLADLSGVTVVGREGGRDHLTGTIPAARVKALTAGLVGDQTVVLGLWLDSEDGHILRAELSTTGDSGITDWVIELSEFDQPVTIEPPAAG